MQTYEFRIILSFALIMEGPPRGCGGRSGG
jgi:hypothetical protein